MLSRLESVRMNALDLEFEDLTEMPEYADFVETAQYREWVARQP